MSGLSGMRVLHRRRRKIHLWPFDPKFESRPGIERGRSRFENPRFPQASGARPGKTIAPASEQRYDKQRTKG
jgi:hypothetical protein